MAGLIPREFINDLLLRVDIVDLIDSHVPLKKAGSNYMARCPFHTEKSPSFSVNRNKQFYHCFGCGVSGNAVSFLMDFSHLDFVEAIEELAGFVGIDVPHEASSNRNSAPQDNLKELYQLLEQVARFYAQQLRATNPQAQTAIAYLKNRGVSGQIAKAFMLGYAPEQWDALLKHFPAKALLDAGLLVKNESGKQYDRFRGRVMFPIRDKRGRVIGFGGRVLDDSQPKYLNSPETAVFSKGQHVYGLYELLQKNSKPQRILVVEGYMDVIALAQFGIDYAVATLGTATSKAHIDLLFRICPELVFCFDGDKAGQQAAWRATEAALPSLRDGRQVRIMLLPEGHDPDSLVRNEGVGNFEERIISAQALSEYFFAHFIATLDLSTMEGRAKLAATAKPLIEQLPTGIFKQMMEAQLKQLSQAPELVFSENTTTLELKITKPKPKQKKHLSPARVAIALLLQNPHLAESVVEKMPAWEGLEFPGLDVLKNLLHTILNYHPANTGALIEMYRGLVEEKIIKTLASWEFLFPESGIAAEFSDAIDNLIAQAKQEKITQLLAKENTQGLSTTEKDQLKKMLLDKQRLIV
jgi:DNA primase